jgi:hypothetical protein
MTTRLIIGLVSFCIAVAGVFTGNLLLIEVIGQINKLRPVTRAVPFTRTPFATMTIMEILREYRRSYPASKLHIYAKTCLAVGISGFVATAACLMIR